MRAVRVRLAFVPRDVWLGLYIGEAGVEGGYRTRTYYVCIVPMLPLCISTHRRIPEAWS